MRHLGISSLAGALLAIASLSLACVDVPGGGTTGGTVLYAYDNNAKQLIEWDASAFYDSDNPTTLKIVSSTVFTNKMGNLSWGGLCLDSSSNRLYLVNETTGDVVRVNNIRGQRDTVPNQDVATFTLGSSSSDRLSSGKFGQAAIDPATGTLFVTEKNDSDTRIWVVSGAGTILDGAKVQPTSITVSGDKECTGIAAGLGGQVFAFFNTGNAIGTIDQINGPRLRKGTSSGFSTNTSVLVGANTTLGKYGSLALDTGNNLLFVARHNVDSAASGIPVMAFSIGKFNGGGYNQAPDFTLGTAADQGNIRVLTHPGNKEWLAALNSSGETHANVIHMWKLPRDKSVAKIKNITSALIKGIAFDGNN